MKTTLIIFLALFTLSSCKFSYDKAKVEESYGSSDGGSGGGGGGSPTCDPDPTQSSIEPDPSTPFSIADGSIYKVIVKIRDCNGVGVENQTINLVITATDTPTSNCITGATSGDYECEITSTYAEDKNISITSPIAVSMASPVTFTKPPLTLNLKACLGGNPSPVAAGLNLPFVSPFVVKPQNFLTPFPSYFTNNEISQPYIPPATALDWVLVQIYDATSGTSVDAKSGFIHLDGSITDPSGNPISFTSSISPNLGYDYRLNLIHRNHLPIGYEGTVTNAANPFTLDLTNPATEYFGQAPISSPTEDPFIMVGPKKCLRPGDFNQDFIVDNDDELQLIDYLFGPSGIVPNFSYWTNSLSMPGYYNSDITLNGSSYIFNPPPVSAWVEDVDAIRDNTMTGSNMPIWGNGLTVP